MKDLEKENLRLRRAISDLTLDKLILQEAARENFCPPRGEGAASIISEASWQYSRDGPAECLASIDRRSARCRERWSWDHL